MKEAIIQYNDNPDADGGHMVISWKPLVRCKDCKHGFTCEFDIKCENEWNPQMFGTRHKPDWFCADGEHK